MVSYKNYLKDIDEDHDEDENEKYHGNRHHFEELMENVAWKDIMTQLQERLKDIRDDLEDPRKSPNEVSVAILRQEASDIRWFMQLPEMTIRALENTKEGPNDKTDAASV